MEHKEDRLTTETLQKLKVWLTAKQTISNNTAGNNISEVVQTKGLTQLPTEEIPSEPNVSEKSFENDSNLVTGRKTRASPYRCDKCGKSFRWSYSQARHMAVHVAAERPNMCGVCGKSFDCKRRLTLHMKIHREENQYICGVCAKSYRGKVDLINHMRTHTQELPFRCDVCGKEYTSRGTLVKHMRLHTREIAYNMAPVKSE